MKKIYISLLLLLILLIRCYAQENLVPNGGFEIGNGNAVPRCFGHYSTIGNSLNFDADIAYWKQAQPHPDCILPQGCLTSSDWQDINLCTDVCNPPNASLYPSNRYVMAEGHDDIDKNEGVRVALIKDGQNYHLIPGMRYRFRIKLQKQSTTSRLLLDFTKWGQHWKSTASGNERWLSVVEIDLSGSEFFECNWYSFEREFTARSDMSELGNMILRSHNNWIGIDDVELYEYGCNDDLLIENKIYTYKEAEYKAQHIYAGYDVGAVTANGNVVVQANPNIEGYADITYRAAVLVNLMPGFSVEAGANFHAYIAPCECDANSAYAGENYTLCGGGSYQLGTTAQSGHTYEWTSDPPEAINYLSDVNISNPVFTPPPNSSGTVIYTLTVSNPCPEDYPVHDEVVINYNSSPNNNPSVNLSNIVLGDYVSFDVAVGSETEEVIITITDENNNVLNPPRTYTLYPGVDFTCCNFHWQIPDYLSGCIDYKVHVKVRNYCSEVYDVEVIDWPRTPPSQISLNFINNIITPGCGTTSDNLYIEHTGAETYEVYIYHAHNGVEIYHNSGPLLTYYANIWDGACNSDCGSGGGNATGWYNYVLYLRSSCNTEQDYASNLYATYCSSGKTDETNITIATNQQHKLEEDRKLLISEGIKIIPNPNNGVFTVQTNSIDAESIIVQNMLGYTIYQNKNNPAKNIEIDLRNYAVGVYVVKVQTPSGQMFVEKVVYK